MQLNGTVIASQLMEPIRVIATLNATAAQWLAGTGTLAMDFGQNFGGWLRVSIPLPSIEQCQARGRQAAAMAQRNLRDRPRDGVQGSLTLTLRHAELQNPDGSLNTFTNGAANNTDTLLFDPCVLAMGNAMGAASILSYEPSFTSHGFRYAAIDGLDTLWWIENPASYFLGAAITGSFVQGRHISSDVYSDSAALAVDSSGDIVAAVMRASAWTARSTLLSIGVDCPQRDERLGWLADAQLASSYIARSLDAAAFYRMFARSIVSERFDDGSLSDFSPDCDPEDGELFIRCDRSYTRPGDPTWTTAFLNFVMHLWHTYGDIDFLQENYIAMKQYVHAWLSNLDPTLGLLLSGNYGDWVSIFTVDKPRVSSTTLLRNVNAMAEAAAALGLVDDASMYSSIAQNISLSYIRNWWNTTSNSFWTESGMQTGQALAIFAGVTLWGDENLRQRTAATLCDLVINGDLLPPSASCPASQGPQQPGRCYAGHITGGIVAAEAMLPALAMIGRTDLALDVLLTNDYPGWGYMTVDGSGSLWETWSGALLDPEGSSRNHVMFASVATWIQTMIGGLSPSSPGGWSVLAAIDAAVAQRLAGGAANLMTAAGSVLSKWNLASNGFLSFNISIPAPVSATVCVPANEPMRMIIIESGNTVWKEGTFTPSSGISAVTTVQGPLPIAWSLIYPGAAGTSQSLLPLPSSISPYIYVCFNVSAGDFFFTTETN
jgi:alpha-L-rhamnosidase